MRRNIADIIRNYKIIDKALSSADGASCSQLRKLIENEGVGVTNRTIEEDIRVIREELGHEIVANGKLYSYRDRSDTIFSPEMSASEKELLLDLFHSVARFGKAFSGLSQMQERLERSRVLRSGGARKEKREPAVIFHGNDKYLQDRQELFSDLLEHIRLKHVVKIDYHPFNSEAGSLVVSPYFLKEYDERWYLFCLRMDTDVHSVRSLCLDRINKVEVVKKGYRYVSEPAEIRKRFDEIVGISYWSDSFDGDDASPMDIIFAIDNDMVPYLRTKPLHALQEEITKENNPELYRRVTGEYGRLKTWNYHFFRLNGIRPNDELIQRLVSYLGHMIVLEPSALRRKVAKRIHFLNVLYTSDLS